MLKQMLLCGALLVGVVAFSDVLQENMASTPELLKKWQHNQFAKLLPSGGPNGRYAVEISTQKGEVCSYQIDAEAVKGKTLVFFGKVKAEDIAATKFAYQGVKFMIYYMTTAGKSKYIECVPRKLRCGSYGWTQFNTVAKIPEDAIRVSLYFGIQGTSGKALFADLKLLTK